VRIAHDFCFAGVAMELVSVDCAARWSTLAQLTEARRGLLPAFR
jgi:hypothetical protein